MAEQRKCTKLAAVLVEHQSFFSILSNPDCQWAIEHPQDAVKLFADAITNRAKATVNKILEFIRVVSLPAIPKFAAKEKFLPGKTIDGLKVYDLGANFKRHFLGKEEDAAEAIELREQKLLEANRDPAIIAELGGDEKVDIG